MQGRLSVITGDQCHDGVLAVRMFPAQEEGRFISLRVRDESGRDREVGMIHSLDAWPPAVQEAVRRSLARRYLLRHIHEIRKAQTSGKELVRAVLSDCGPATVRLEQPGDGYQSFGNNGLLLTDAQGNYYVIPDRSRLPKRQQRLLTLYLGD